MSESLQVDAAGPLLDLLAGHLSSWHKRTLRQRLKMGCVRVNGQTVTRGDHALQVGDEVEVADASEGQTPLRMPAGISLLHLDDDLVAIGKPAGLLSVSSERERQRTALALVRTALSRPGRPARLWPVHRLDRETSGVLLLARSREASDAVQADWSQTHKTYLAVVAGRPEPAGGLIDAPLWEDRQLAVHVGDGPGAKAARTRFATLEVSGGRSLLEVELDTGRRHQIRAHLAHIGHPVIGDPRYGTRAARMGLHALRLEVNHPADGRRIVFEGPAPAALRALLRG